MFHLKLKSNTKDTEASPFSISVERKSGGLQSFSEVLAAKTIFFRMQKDMFCDEILIQSRVEFFEKKTALRFEHPCHFPKGRLPIRNVVENTEIEDSIQRPCPEGQAESVCRNKSDVFLLI